MYIFIALLIAGFASGYGVSYQISKAEIQHMSDSIDAMNREAEWTLAALTKEADTAHEEALKLNKELEDANVSAINAINSQHDSFKSVRMYDNSRKGSSCPKAKDSNSSTVVSTDEDRRELSDELSQFLKSEAYRADQIAQYAIMCQKFIERIKS
jgi:hypothetical protein